MQKISKKEQERQARIEGVNKIADYALMGILFLFTSLPLITMGVSISALYKTIYEYKLNDKPKYVKIYGQSLRSSFKQSTLVWIGYLLLILAFVLNRNALLGNYSLLKDALQILHILMILLITPVVMLMLFYIGRFNDSLRTILKNTSLILLLNFFKAIKILIAAMIVVVTIWLIPILLMILPPLLIAKGINMIEKIFSQFKLSNSMTN